MTTDNNINENKSFQAEGNLTELKKDHSHKRGEEPDQEDGEDGWRSHIPLISSLVILIIMLTLEFGLNYKPVFPVDLIIFGIAYLLAGFNVLKLAFVKAKHFDFFNEFFLMSVATVGAFAIGSYSEGVAVMVFYSIGEWFQDSAVSKAKQNIKALLDIRPDEVTVLRNGKSEVIHPNDVQVDEII